MTEPFDDHDDETSNGPDRPRDPGDADGRDADSGGADDASGDLDAGLDEFDGEIPLDPDDVETWLASARAPSAPEPSSGAASQPETLLELDVEPRSAPTPEIVSEPDKPPSPGQPARDGDDPLRRPEGASDGDVVAEMDQQRADPAAEDRDDDGNAEPITERETGQDEPSTTAIVHPGGDGWGLASHRSPVHVADWPVIGRLVRWTIRPWTNERIVMFAVTALTLTITTFVIMRVTHMWQWPIIGSPWRPWDWEWQGIGGLVFRDNTPTGGDMGAHVWGSAYLRDELLPNWQLSGWSMDWYAGLPAYRFYMVLPALAIVALSAVFSYGVAFKLVAVAGLVLFPISCWTFGRLARFRYPVPELFAIAAVVFVLDESFEIYGGNLKSTMAGEFSFSIALTLAMFGLGLLARGLETGKYRVRTAVVLAAACISHGIVLIFVMVAATVLVLVWLLVTFDLKRLYYALTVGAATLMLSWFWVGPFFGNRSFMTDMKYESKPADGLDETFWDLFFPLVTPLDFIIMGFATLGVISVVLRRQINGVALTVSGLLFVAGVYLFSDGGLPFGIGLLWNPRLLPFIYLVRYLLMVIGIVELVTTVGNIVRNRPGALVGSVPTRTVTWGVVGLAAFLVLGFMFRVLPFGGTFDNGQYGWGPFRSTEDTGRALGDGWSRYNFEGYEGKDSYPEYYGVVQTMAGLGEDPAHGCGRAYWENHEDNGQYGTTMALMLLPYWTDGCIASMEGLYFEASATTPYHFVASAAMSEASSQPVRELDYSRLDPDAGILQLQSLGVRYVMLRTDAAKDQVDGREELTLVAESGPWAIYELSGGDIVQPLDVQPVVVNGRDGDRRERNLELGMSWFQNQGDWAALPANDGPDDWQRIDVDVDVDEREYRVGDETILWPELVARVEDGRLEALSGNAEPADLVDELEDLATGSRTTLMDTAGQNEEGEPSPQPVSVKREELVETVVPSEQITPTALDPVTVSNVEIDQQSMSFEVDEVGVPVLVRVSYFPNWSASGADGPYRLGPNMMVVVPTDNEVELSYDRSTSDVLAYFVTFLGILLCIGLAVRRRPPRVSAFPPDSWYDDGKWEWGNDENTLVSRYRALPPPMRSLPPGPVPTGPPTDGGEPPPAPPAPADEDTDGLYDDGPNR